MQIAVAADSPRCWAVAISMMIYTFFAMAVLKSSSVLYVGSMDILDLSREAASWPATLCVMLSQLAGPVYGFLLKFTSERTCLIIGALLCSLPLMASAYAEDLITLCLLVGVIQGLGSACSEVIPFVVLMRHFQKYRGTVISAMYIITAVSGFVMPVLYEYIRQGWGFRICLMAMGTINLGMLFGCIVVNRVPVIGHAQSSGPATSAPHFADVSLSTDSYLVGSILLTKSQQNSRTASFVDVESFREKTPLITHVGFKQSRSLGRLHDINTKPGLMSISFLHITLSRAVTIFSLATFLLILLDYASDRHLDSVQGVLILTVFTIGDLMSRILSGSLIDLKLISHEVLMSVTFLIQGASYLLLINVDVYGIMLVASFLVGLTGGCRNILATVMVTEECDDSSLALSLGVMNFITGVTIFCQPALIGYVRDTLGSYEPLLLGFVICNVILFFTWMVKVFCDCRKRIVEFV